MPLAANSRLGPYEIKSTLGVGGMGEVYRARDSRLNRDVAIKVLRSDSTATPELKSRFEREARAVAALNHPNIVSVFDFGIDGDSQYIVSELIEGESLRQVIAGKPVATRRLVDIAVQIADGLAAAHTAGIVHRDLKPENILVTKDGRAKILDFGLARQTTKTVPANSSDETFLPDSNANLTSAGSILGTASYMSPEQAVGKEMDYRSDQFSFGLILHEMATGKQTFARNSSVETMAAIVRDEPPPIEQKLPAPLKWIIDRCLAKEPEQRYESTRDLYRDLKSLRDHFSDAYSSSGVLAPVPSKQRIGRRMHPVIFALGLALVCALVAFLLKPSGQNIGDYRYTPFASNAYGAMWSPDGKAVAFSSSVNGIYQVFLRYLDSSVPLQLTHAKHDMYALGWSSDRNHLIVVDDVTSLEFGGTLYSVPTVGGELDPIMNCGVSCDLSRDGMALATLAKGHDGSYTVFVSNPVGAPPIAYTPSPFASKEIYDSPQVRFSPDGKHILLYRTGDGNRDEAWLLSYPAGGEAPRHILKKLHTFYPPTICWMSDNRHLVLSLASSDSPTHLWVTNLDSDQLEPLTTGTLNESEPTVSPNDNNIIYTQTNRPSDLVSVSLADGSTNVLTSTGFYESMPAWSANDPKLTWVTNRSGAYEIWLRTPDGSERPVVTARDFPVGTSKWFFNPSLSPDGNRLLYTRIDQAGVGQVWISPLSGGTPIPVANGNRSRGCCGSWSPDGTRLVYIRGENGKNSLVIAKADGNAAPIAIRENGPSLIEIPFGAPEWSPTGEWITYRDVKGWNLISPDGKKLKFLGDISTDYLAFSKNGKLLYGILVGKTEADRERATLFSLDPATLKQTVIKELGKDFRPYDDATNVFTMSVRFSLSPDGKSIVYAVSKSRRDLWMLTGYRRPSLWNQLTSVFSAKAEHQK